MSNHIARDEAPKPGAVIRYDTRLRLRHAPQEVQFVRTWLDTLRRAADPAGAGTSCTRVSASS